MRITIRNRDGSSVGIEAEVADTFFKRAKGLMGRKELAENEGMLFVFDTPGIYALWMFNTSIPLDAIFIDEKGIVVGVMSMEPCGINPFCPHYSSKTKAKYILEVNQGFAREHNIEIGKSCFLIKKKR